MGPVTGGTGAFPHALDAARRGEAEGLGALWRTHQPLLLRYLRGRGLDDADGLTSQIWLDAARNLARFDGGEEEFRRWLFTIAHRRVVDARRRAARQPSTRTLDDDGLGAEVAPGADVVYDDRDALGRALALVATLPDAMREAVLLRIVADLPVADVAAVMGIGDGHVRVLVHRGLRRLERQLVDGSIGKLQPVV